MNEMNNSPTCERASDLIAFLYNETSESETRDFQLHLKECSECRAEVASFGLVRESITAWRDEALSGFVSTPLPSTARTKSAIAALRQFFDLSPLWLKGATAFAAVTFCVLTALAVFRVPANNNNVSSNQQTERGSAGSTPTNPNAVYTREDVDRLVKEALANAKQPVFETIAQTPKPKRIATPSQVAKSRRPLSRAEREQLAADLRLLSTYDDGLNLLGDRINR